MEISAKIDSVREGENGKVYLRVGKIEHEFESLDSLMGWVGDLETEKFLIWTLVQTWAQENSRDLELLAKMRAKVEVTVPEEFQ